MWPKIKSSLRGESPKEHIANAGNNLNVNEEYLEAFRTKSYTEIWSKVQGQLRRTTQERLSLSPFPSYTHLSDYLLEPRQDVLLAMIENNSNLHDLILDYFEGSLEASKMCGYLLHIIDRARKNYRIIQRVVKLTKRVDGDYTDEKCRFIFKELASFAMLENPLSGSSPVQFGRIHDLHSSLIERLMFTRKKIMRRVKFIRLCKKTSGIALVITCAAVTVTVLVVMAHGSFIGVLAVPVLLTSSFALLKRRFESVRRFMTSSLASLGAQLDAAAKGAYILNRDFDTMSRLVTRLHDEIEHSKAVIRICLRNEKRQLLEEVVKEFESNESCFLEQLEELEEHVCLCFLTINRARRLVIQEITVHQQPS